MRFARVRTMGMLLNNALLRARHCECQIQVVQTGSQTYNSWPLTISIAIRLIWYLKMRISLEPVSVSSYA